MAFWINAVQSQSQAITIILKDSTRHTGYVMKEDSARIKFSAEDLPAAKWFNKEDILNYDSKAQKIDLHYKAAADAQQKQASDYFIGAGGFGVASVLLMVGGVVSTSVGAATGNKIAIYSGAGLSGAGLIFLIPTFTNVINGGKALRQKDL